MYGIKKAVLYFLIGRLFPLRRIDDGISWLFPAYICELCSSTESNQKYAAKQICGLKNSPVDTQFFLGVRPWVLLTDPYLLMIVITMFYDMQLEF